MDRLLADETILRILSHLDAKDLAQVQVVSTHLCSLAKDRLLWKRLFYFTFVQPGESTLSEDARSAILPTLRELRSLLLHQNLFFGKAMTGDGSRHIHRLPGRFYSSSTDSRLSSASPGDVDRDVSSLYVDGFSFKTSSASQLLDWEQIYRVSSNWQKGRFGVSELRAIQPRDRSPTVQLRPSLPRQTVVRVSHSFIFAATSTSTRNGTIIPAVSVYSSESAPGPSQGSKDATIHRPSDLDQKIPVATILSPGLETMLAARPSDSTMHVHITEIAVDADITTEAVTVDTSGPGKRKSPDGQDMIPSPAARIVVAYSTGQISLFGLGSLQGRITAVEEVFCRPVELASDDHITMAALHSPALVLCSSKFDVAFYQIDAAAVPRLSLAHRMTSYRCSWPASLRLKKLPCFDSLKRPRRASPSSSPERHSPNRTLNESAFRVTLAYSTPSYPSSWSVSVQELVVRLSASATAARVSSRHATAKHPFRPSPLDLRGRSMLSSEFAPSLRAPFTGQDQADLRATQAPASTAGKSMSLTYDDPFVVLGASDNLIEVYELLGATTFVRSSSHVPSSISRSATATPSSRKQSLRLVHRRSLHGHTGSVHSVALEDGRCVSGSADGSVMIWTLGDRSNETDSIANAMRIRRSATRDRGQLNREDDVGPRSASSTILEEEEEGDEAASHMGHVLTLRTPTNLERTGLSDSTKEDTRRSTHPNGRSIGPSLGQIVRSRVLDRQARGIVRWVSTAFDKIVSIVAYPGAHSTSTNPLDAGFDSQLPRERVQVWTFG